MPKTILRTTDHPRLKVYSLAKKKSKREPMSEAAWPRSTVSIGTTIAKTLAMSLYRLNKSDLSSLHFETSSAVVTIKGVRVSKTMYLFKERDVEAAAWRRHGGPDNYYFYLNKLRASHELKQREKPVAQRKTFQAPPGYIAHLSVAQKDVCMVTDGRSHIDGTHAMQKFWTATDRLQELRDKLPTWLWFTMIKSLDWHEPGTKVIDNEPYYTPYRDNYDRERVIEFGLKQLTYPRRSENKLPLSASVTALRDVLKEAPRDPHNPLSAVEGIEQHEDYEGNVEASWSNSYLKKLYPALVEVIREHGVGDAGWKTVRWEVYDTYTDRMGGISYTEAGPRSWWHDKASAWLCGQTKSMVISEERKSIHGTDYIRLLPPTGHCGLARWERGY